VNECKPLTAFHKMAPSASAQIPHSRAGASPRRHQRARRGHAGVPAADVRGGSPPRTAPPSRARAVEWAPPPGSGGWGIVSNGNMSKSGGGLSKSGPSDATMMTSDRIPSLWGRVVPQPLNSSLKGVVWLYCLGSVPHFHTVRCRISSITHFWRVACSVTRWRMIRVR